jgi:hypothetical protein
LIEIFSQNRALHWRINSTFNSTFVGISYLVLFVQKKTETKTGKFEKCTDRRLQNHDKRQPRPKVSSFQHSNNCKFFRAFGPWQIKPENIRVKYDKKLGSGAFSDVFAGKLLGDAAIKNVYPNILMLLKFRDCKVAVKTLPMISDEWSRKDFQQANIWLIFITLFCLGNYLYERTEIPQ